MIYLNNDFNEVHTFECGQCFRWNPSGCGYIGVVGGRVCRAEDGCIYCPEEDNEFFSAYFAADVDYGRIKAELLRRDPGLLSAIEFGSGIRILHQDMWETIISFIISANNNIPRIKKIIEALCRKFGDVISPPPGIGLPDTEYYSFPSAERLMNIDISELSELKAGYRDKYILHAAQMVGSGAVDLSALPQMSTRDARAELMRIKGVGAKVADCILLFSAGRYEVFPKDVWIKRVVAERYGTEEKEIDSFIGARFGSLAGYAQQYLYYHSRERI